VEAARNAWAINECADLYSKAAELAADEDTRRQIRLRRGLALVAPLH
jgi:hypothetical protein